MISIGKEFPTPTSLRRRGSGIGGTTHAGSTFTTTDPGQPYHDPQTPGVTQICYFALLLLYQANQPASKSLKANMKATKHKYKPSERAPL